MKARPYLVLHSTAATVAFILLSTLIGGCASQPGSSLQPNGRLAPCPSAPHCVSSDDADSAHRIAPLAIQGDTAAAWQALKKQLQVTPRMKIVAESDDYLHAVATTRLMRFKDDLEFVLHPDRNLIAMRSSSRVGHSDFGVNRKRLETLRAALHAQGVVF